MTTQTKVTTPAGMPNSEHPVVGWLWQITDPLRPVCARPWTLEYEGETWTLATNGMVLAMRRGTFGFDPCPSPLDIYNVLKGGGETFPFPLSEVRALLVPPAPEVVDTLPPCVKCDNTGNAECDECEGDGEIECTCFDCDNEHTRDCAVCAGSGLVACSCGRVPKKEDAIVPWLIGIGRFNKRLLATAIPHIPDAPATWRQAAPVTVATLDAGEWRILLMPLRIEGTEPERVIELPPRDVAA